jgi:hypothetical protein
VRLSVMPAEGLPSMRGSSAAPRWPCIREVRHLDDVPAPDEDWPIGPYARARVPRSQQRAPQRRTLNRRTVADRPPGVDSRIETCYTRRT